MLAVCAGGGGGVLSVCVGVGGGVNSNELHVRVMWEWPSAVSTVRWYVTDDST